MFSHTILKRFVKDYKLPIQIVQTPYFEYFIELYDDLYKTKEKYQLLTDTLSKFESENAFLDQYDIIKDNILNAMKSTTIFKQFNNSKLDEFNIPQHSFSKDNVFNLDNVNKTFMSIDLEKANFQAMKFYNKDLVLGFNTYDDLISNFTDLDYMKKSKYIRQVLFGNMNPKKQIKIETYLTYNILQFLLNENYFTKDMVKMFSPDEIVIELNDIIDDKKIKEIIKEKFNLNTDIEIYKLDNIKPYKFFVKEFINKNGYEFVCIPLVYHAQVYKRYNNLILNENDLLFFYENQIAKFIKPLDFENEIIFSENEE